MIVPQDWVPAALDRLRETFGARLLYLGLQGSYRRGEATETSDIDLVTILDTVSLDDLDRYRDIVRAQPEGEKACGFIAGRDELLHWPRHELFPLKMDTADHFGKLEDFLPPVTRSDIETNLHIGASGLYHLLAHSYLYAAPADRPAVLSAAYKSAYFVMQVAHYLATGEYHTSKRALYDRLTEDEREIIGISQRGCVACPPADEKRLFALLFAWSGKIVNNPHVG